MPNKHTETNGRPSTGRPVEDLIRAALRADGFLVPQTVEEVRRFEEELARNPLEVPAHLLTPEWLFGSVDQSAKLPSPADAVGALSDNLAMAARDGSEIPAEIT